MDFDEKHEAVLVIFPLFQNTAGSKTTKHTQNIYFFSFAHQSKN